MGFGSLPASPPWSALWTLPTCVQTSASRSSRCCRKCIKRKPSNKLRMNMIIPATSHALTTSPFPIRNVAGHLHRQNMLRTARLKSIQKQCPSGDRSVDEVVVIAWRTSSSCRCSCSCLLFVDTCKLAMSVNLGLDRQPESVAFCSQISVSIHGQGHRGRTMAG